MEYVGIDLHKVHSQICILTSDGEVIEQRIQTSRERFSALFGGRERSQVLLESSTESEWVARHLESLGHEVIVADPNFLPMYMTRSKKTKTDRRDARALADACRLKAYRPAHRVSEEQRRRRVQLTLRDALVRTRTRYISILRAMARGEGLRVESGSSAAFAKRLARLTLPSELAPLLEPLLQALASINEQIERIEKEIAARSAADERVQRLQTVPGVGPIVSTAFLAAVDDAKRFAGPHQLEAYLGLVPREHSSGEKQRKGSITKTGPSRMRRLLVQSSWVILLSRRADAAPLRQWAERIAQRRGKRVAVVALGRKLAGILFALLRDGSVYRVVPRPACAPGDTTAMATV
jgi:transposase